MWDIAGGLGGGGGHKASNNPRHIQHSPRHTNDWAPTTRKRHQQEHRLQRPMQQMKGGTGDCPGPRKEPATRWHVTHGGGGGAWALGESAPGQRGPHGPTGCLSEAARQRRTSHTPPHTPPSAVLGGEGGLWNGEMRGNRSVPNGAGGFEDQRHLFGGRGGDLHGGGVSSCRTLGRCYRNGPRCSQICAESAPPRTLPLQIVPPPPRGGSVGWYGPPRRMGPGSIPPVDP